MTRIIFIAEGGPDLGMGHIIHSLALAEELKEKAEIILLTNSQDVAAPWIAAGYECQYPKAGRAKAMLKALMPQVVIFDTLYPDRKVMQWIKESLGAKIAVCNCMDDAAELLADLVVAGDAHGLENRREKKLIYDRFTPRQWADFTQLRLTGPRYWVLRQEFYDVYLRAVSRGSKDILMRIGGADNHDLSIAIKNVLGGLNVTIIEGHGYAAREMAREMADADLVICSPGLTPFEALLVGTPVIIIPKDEEQRSRYAAIPLLGKEDIGKLPEIIQHSTFIRPTDSAVKRMQIGQGKHEVVQAIEAWL